ncbi:DNA/RNA non-specific endonuclease [Salmonirosea aquatica]|uniref:Endonuclease n=1 Tax=Salmonirosea aquatica TaxID=2654236 RepID=A0A7C9BDE4_9BACT|nr:DNA/RNA non-specific endonuclease [Cytophagaceae bacterium SJW1-29]
MRNQSILTCLLAALLLAGCAKRTLIPQSAESIHTSLGNPTAARRDTTDADNYLILKKQYALSYNRSLGHANWVSWESDAEWLGEADRRDDFRPDPDLPTGWYRVRPDDYTNSGFDRGHLCPSASRTASDADNSSTFVMTNMIPQAPPLNHEAWAQLEAYCRTLAGQGYRLFIVAGSYGVGGKGSKGYATTLNGRVSVPAHNYKVIVAVANLGDVGQIDRNTPVIAVDFPNDADLVDNKSWNNFVTTPGEIERSAGVTFFNYLSDEVRSELRRVRFDPTNTPLGMSNEDPKSPR